MSVLFNDIECYRDFFYVGFKRQSDGVRIGFEISRRKNTFDAPRIRQIMRKNLNIGYNCAGYDIPMIAYALSLVDKDVPVVDPATQKVVVRRLTADEICLRLKKASDRIIQGKVRYWEVEKLLDISIPKDWDYIDLIEPQPNAFASLKTLNGRLHGKRLQDLPYEPDARLTDEQMEDVADYCLTSDLDATENLYEALRESLELRVALGKEYDQDFRSKSDSQIGEAIIKKRVEQLAGSRPQKVDTPPGTTFRYPIPPFLKFETPQLQSILERLRETEFIVKDDGKVDLPKWLSDQTVTLGSSTYAMGIGGLHSTESNRAVRADEQVLIDMDVAAYYPTIILKSGLYPRAIGKRFLEIYKKIRDSRVEAKAKAKAIKKEIEALEAQLAEMGGEGA